MRPRPCSFLPTAVTHAAIVRRYVGHEGQGLAAELRWFARGPHLRDAIRRAALARDASQKRLPHRRRLARTTMPAALDRFVGARNKIARARDFPELIVAIRGAIGSIRGAGDLYVYDTALRIGAFKGIEPDLVYLHAGARVGAEAVFKRRMRQPALRASSFPREFRRLRPKEIENLLCCYAECL